LKPSRSDFLLALFRFVVEFILDMALCAKVRLVLPLISLARIGVAPLRKPVGRAACFPSDLPVTNVAGAGWCRFVGFVFWGVSCSSPRFISATAHSRR
jgi:hypothetical protein